MADTTVRDLAESVGIPIDRLLVQLGESGLPHKDANQHVNDDEKAQLLSHLRQLHGKGEGDEIGPKKISLKRRSVRELKIASPQGRRKTVTVEVRRRRTYVRSPDEAGEDATVEVADTEELALERMEVEKRALLEEAKRRQQELDEKLRAEEEVRERQEKERQHEEEERRRVEAVAMEAEASATEARPEPGEAATMPAVDPATVEQIVVKEQAAAVAARKSEARKSERAPKKGERVKHERKELHVATEKSGRRRKKPRPRPVIKPTETKHAFEMPTAPVVREVALTDTITIGELAQKMSIKATDLIRGMMNLGIMATINQVLDQETAILVVEEFGHKAKLIREDDVEAEILTAAPDTRDAAARPPVITIMGHVDHGKTSLLDYIRRTKVAAGEAGGITQHIGAYRVSTARGDIAFIDTPGHAAFTAMRARGAKATDIVVLVVAADDGVMPQTIEAIQHSKAAGVPIVVAINKIDREDANLERIKQDLSNHEVIPEDWGGDTMFVSVSATTGEGVESLLEAIGLQSELLELRAPVEGPAKGVVIESRLDRGRGAVATVLVQSGKLSKGDFVLAGQEFGRVRGLYDHLGQEIQSAGPSVPVELLGLSSPPNAGDEAVVLPDERKAREIASFRQGKSREVRLAKARAGSIDNVFELLSEGNLSAVNLVVKADVQGSVEALREALEKLSTDEVKVKIISSATGGISETDVNLAIASNAIIIGFNVRADATARRLVESESLDIHYFSVIYDVIDTVKQAINGLLSPEIREEIIGLAEVRDIFRSKKFGDIAGCIVMEGVVKRQSPIRVLRDNVVIYEGDLESLRRFKDDVNEVRSGTECGIGVRNYNDVKSGDQIEVFERIEVERRI